MDMDQIDMLLELAIKGDRPNLFQAAMEKYPLDVTSGTQVYKGRTPLHLAAMNGCTDIVKIIMSSSRISIQVVNARDRYGLSPLHLAIRSEHKPIVRILTTSPWVLPGRFSAATSVEGELVQEQDCEGFTQYLHLIAAWTGNIPIVKLVLRMTTAATSVKGELVQEQDCDGFTHLHLAAWTGNIPIVKLVLRMTCQVGTAHDPVNIHATTWQGNTALDIAKERHHVALVDLLECFDVNWLQAERERSASSVNTILVGAALVAAIAFGCWLQPPLGIPDMDARNNVLRIPHLEPQTRTKFQVWFFVSVALSLALSMMALVTGTLATLPSRWASSRREVHRLRRSVQTASVFLFMAILFLALAAHFAGLLVFRSVAFADNVVTSVGENIVQYTSLFCLFYIFWLVFRTDGVYGMKTRALIFVSTMAVFALQMIESAILKCYFHKC